MTAPTLAPVTLDTPRGRWSIAAKTTRDDDGIDVLLKFRATGAPRPGRLYAFRRTAADGWMQVVGAHAPVVTLAIRAVAKEHDTMPITHTALIPLMVAAAELPDHPAARGGDQ